MTGTNCVNPVFITATITFSIPNNDHSLFNNEYEGIVSGLATAVGVPRINIVVGSIVYNSVILGTGVIVPVGGNSGDVENKVNSYFKDLSITGITVQSASVTNPDSSNNNNNNNNSSDDDDDSSNTTLIVAIVVPIVVVRNFYLI